MTAVLTMACSFEGGLPLFLVGDVKRGRDPAPTGPIRIWAYRDGTWRITEPVDPAQVEWARLHDNDRIEVLPVKSNKQEALPPAPSPYGAGWSPYGAGWEEAFQFAASYYLQGMEDAVKGARDHERDASLLQTLEITDRANARRALNSPGCRWTHVVSIGDPGSHRAVRPGQFGDRLLRLEFDADGPRGVTLEHVQAIAAFGRALPAEARLLVHCELGISRSTAAAAIILMARSTLSEDDAVKVVRQIRSQAVPNQRMLALYREMEKKP